MNKLNIVFLMIFLVSCNFYNLELELTVTTHNERMESINIDDSLDSLFREWEVVESIHEDPLKQALFEKYGYGYVHILNNKEFIDKSFSENGIELNILYAFGTRHSNRFFFNWLNREWEDHGNETHVWINSHVIFSIRDVEGKIDFSNENIWLTFGENSPSSVVNHFLNRSSPLFYDYDNDMTYFLAIRVGHYEFHAHENEGNFPDIEELYIEFFLDLIKRDLYTTREIIDIDIPQILEQHSATRLEYPITTDISPEITFIQVALDIEDYNTNFLNFNELDIYLGEGHYLLNIMLTEKRGRNYVLEILTRQPQNALQWPRRVNLLLELTNPISPFTHLFSLRYIDESIPNNSMKYVQTAYSVNINNLADYNLFFSINHFRDVIEVGLGESFYINTIIPEELFPELFH